MRIILYIFTHLTIFLVLISSNSFAEDKIFKCEPIYASVKVKNGKHRTHIQIKVDLMCQHLRVLLNWGGSFFLTKYEPVISILDPLRTKFWKMGEHVFRKSNMF